MDRPLNERHNLPDRLQLAALVGLMFMGAAFVFSATVVNQSLVPWYDEMWIRQIIWYVLGLGAGVALCLVDYHTQARWSYVAYWAMIFCLVAVLIVGTVHGGARRWFDLKVFQFQPSEFAKLSFILAMANFLSRPPNELKLPANFWRGIGLMLLPFVLILKEPDLGSALVLVPTGLAMMFVAGIPRRYLLQLAGAVGILAVLFLADILFAPRHSANPHRRLPAPAFAGLFRRGFCGCKCDARTKRPRRAEMQAEEFVSGETGAHFRRLRRVDRQRLVQGHPNRLPISAARCGP